MDKLITSKIRFFIRMLFLFMVLGVSNNCSKDTMNDTPATGGNPTGKSPGANEVWMQSSLYNPETITVTAGTTITWTNKDGIIHTVTSDTGLFDSGNIASNGTYSLKFANSGTFPYHCTFHPAMTGKVVVN